MAWVKVCRAPGRDAPPPPKKNTNEHGKMVGAAVPCGPHDSPPLSHSPWSIPHAEKKLRRATKGYANAPPRAPRIPLPDKGGQVLGLYSFLWQGTAAATQARRNVTKKRGIDLSSAKRYNSVHQHRRGGESLPLSGARSVKDESPEPVRACKPLRTVPRVGGRRKEPRIPKRCRGAYATAYDALVEIANFQKESGVRSRAT